MRVEIRPAAITDAEAIVAIHFAAVHQTAASSYPSQVLESWSPSPDENRHSLFRRAIENGDELFVVAESDGVIVGFGVVIPAECELRAVYVHPNTARRGVGSAILGRLEELALGRGIVQLHLDASLNAEAFYLKNGYATFERGVHPFASGIQMECVKMRKLLMEATPPESANLPR